MNLDWRRLKAVVIESDDWGLCAWSADEQAHRVLADTPAFRSPAGRRYAGSTLEGAADIETLTAALSEFRGGDGFPPVWQANTVVAAPDYDLLHAPSFECDAVPLVDLPRTPSRWRRPGAWEAVQSARAQGLWWPELHGLHHIPEAAWLKALRRGRADARRAFEHQSPVCEAVEASGEHDPTEPAELRTRNLALAVAKFRSLTGRAPASFCPPDYRFDDSTEHEAAKLGIRVLQGKGEQAGVRLPRVRRFLMRHRWPDLEHAPFRMPPRVAFEPGAGLPQVGVAPAHRAARDAWSRGQPVVLSSHRVNYVHLDPERAAHGLGQLRDLLRLLVADGAVFLTDAEVRQLLERSWSAREIGDRGVLVRYYGVPRDVFRFPAPARAARVSVVEGRGPDEVQVSIEGGEVMARLNVGEYLLEWK